MLHLSLRVIGAWLLVWSMVSWAQDDFAAAVKPSAECKAANDCPAGAYLVQNAAELVRLSQVLENLGQVNQITGHWTNNRYAILVESGDYAMTEPFHLGYYTQVLGLGEHPSDVDLIPGIVVYNQCLGDCSQTDPTREYIGGLNNFWRGIENLQMTIAPEPLGDNNLRLAISQATALRRLNVIGGENNKLVMCDYYTENWACGYASGGFMANSRVADFVPGSQQQWLTRNSHLGTSETAVWNAIFVGSIIDNLIVPNPSADHYGPTENDWSNFPITTVAKTPTVKEKPYLIKNASGYRVVVPPLKKGTTGEGTIGVDWDETSPSIDISEFHVISSKPDATGVTTINSTEIAQINTSLASGKHLIIMPGVYHLGGTLQVTKEDTVVLGLGLPALVCTNGPCINVDVEKGVRLAGITFDAGYDATEYLLRIGQGSKSSNSDNPHVLSDVYMRIAETQDEIRTRIRQTETALIINSNGVIGDNLWIWRGDHDKASGDDIDASKNLVKWNENTARYGIIVHGDDVTMYGLAVEHFQDYQTVWYGERGRVYFYQSEAPYDFDSTLADAWLCTDPISGLTSDVGGCAAYVIDKKVNDHTAFGVGIYSYFAFEKIQLPSAILAPTNPGINIQHIIGHWLNGVSDSSILNLVRDYADETERCWGYQATCTETQEIDDTGFKICTDGNNGQPFKQTSVLGAFNVDTYTKPQTCTVPVQSKKVMM